MNVCFFAFVPFWAHKMNLCRNQCLFHCIFQNTGDKICILHPLIKKLRLRLLLLLFQHFLVFFVANSITYKEPAFKPEIMKYCKCVSGAEDIIQNYRNITRKSKYSRSCRCNCGSSVDKILHEHRKISRYCKSALHFSAIVHLLLRKQCKNIKNIALLEECTAYRCNWLSFKEHQKNPNIARVHAFW